MAIGNPMVKGTTSSSFSSSASPSPHRLSRLDRLKKPPPPPPLPMTRPTDWQFDPERRPVYDYGGNYGNPAPNWPPSNPSCVWIPEAIAGDPFLTATYNQVPNWRQVREANPANDVHREPFWPTSSPSYFPNPEATSVAPSIPTMYYQSVSPSLIRWQFQEVNPERRPVYGCGWNDVHAAPNWPPSNASWFPNPEVTGFAPSFPATYYQPVSISFNWSQFPEVNPESRPIYEFGANDVHLEKSEMYVTGGMVSPERSRVTALSINSPVVDKADGTVELGADEREQRTEKIGIPPNGRINISSCRKVRLLGRSSSSSVYEAMDENGFVFAVKEIFIDQGNKAEESSIQLKREVSILSHLQHQNIVQYYGIDLKDGMLYIFLELAAKGSLASVCRDRPIEDSQASAYTLDILNGLNYLHGKNILHRFTSLVHLEVQI